jgi:hypothetical protein
MPFITGSLIYQRVRRLAAWYGARSRLAQVLGQRAEAHTAATIADELGATYSVAASITVLDNQYATHRGEPGAWLYREAVDHLEQMAPIDWDRYWDTHGMEEQYLPNTDEET